MITWLLNTLSKLGLVILKYGHYIGLALIIITAIIIIKAIIKRIR